MTKAETCRRCRGQGVVKVAQSNDRVVPASIREKGALICDACDGEGFLTSPDIETPKLKHTYPSWMKDADE
jgi:DnaJ-class molecular chaperone